jgi:hypothetical protein
MPPSMWRRGASIRVQEGQIAKTLLFESPAFRLSKHRCRLRYRKNRKSPLSVVVSAERRASVPVFVSSVLAAEITLPEGYLTVPSTVPEVDCARRTAPPETAISAAKRIVRMLYTANVRSIVFVPLSKSLKQTNAERRCESERR